MVTEIPDGLDDQNVEQPANLVDGQGNQPSVGGFCWRGLSVVGGANCQDGEGGQRKGGEPVPGVPTADLVLVEPDLAFGGLEALFDGPPDPGNAHEGGQGGRLRRP